MRDIRLDGLFTLRSPLSHIGETLSTTSFLAEEQILQPDGGAEPVFAYAGNAWRGQLRDLMAAYMLDRLGAPALSLDAFHLLFSGGRIGGAQTIDLDQARRMRTAIPLVALLGGGVGNQIIEGKLRVGTSYPLCREALPVLPADLHAAASRIDYADCTITRDYSRRDDSRIDSIARYLPAAEQPLLAEPGGKAKKRGKEAGGAADQMRVTAELVAPGVRLRTWIGGRNVTEVEIGCLVSGLHRFAASPHIGGKSGTGHGLVDLSYRLTDVEAGTTVDFVRIEDGAAELAPPAADAKAAYDAHLRSLYDAALQSKAGEIAALLGAAA